MDKGEIWIYMDEESQKRRPCVVVGNSALAQESDILIAKLTSRPPRNKFDVTIEQWVEAGLLEISCVRTTKLHSVNEEVLLYRVAKLTDFDLIKVKTRISEYILF